MKRKSGVLGFIQPFGAMGYLMPCLKPTASLPGAGISSASSAAEGSERKQGNLF